VQRIQHGLSGFKCGDVQMTTINFCGDSFCACGGPRNHIWKKELVDKEAQFAWTTILAAKLGADIIGFGAAGTAHENCFKTYDDTADYTVFCWTEPHRLYHDNFGISMSTADKFKQDKKIYATAYLYYKYLHDVDLAIARFQRECYWFDHAILTNYKGKCIHLDCFANLYTWNVGIKHSLGILNDRRPLRDHPGDPDDDQCLPCHLTVKQNVELADELFDLFCKDIS
jgi:hypothetical protein